MQSACPSVRYQDTLSVSNQHVHIFCLSFTFGIEVFLVDLLTLSWTFMLQGIRGSPGLTGPRGKPGPQVFFYPPFKH